MYSVYWDRTVEESMWPHLIPQYHPYQTINGICLQFGQISIHFSQFHYLQGREKRFPFRAGRQRLSPVTWRTTLYQWPICSIRLQATANLLCPTSLALQTYLQGVLANHALNEKSNSITLTLSATIGRRFNSEQTKSLIGSLERAALTTTANASVRIMTGIKRRDQTRGSRRTTSWKWDLETH